MRLVKDTRLLLPLTEMMKIAKLTSPLLDVPRQSSPRPRAEAWQTTCCSLSPKSNPKTVYSLLYSIAGSPPSSPNFPNYSSPRESVSVYAPYLRSHFSISQPKALCSRARAYLSEVCRATCLEESHSSFCSFFSLAEFLAAAHFSPSSLMIFRPLCLLPSAALFMLTIWPFGPPHHRSPLQWRPHKELCFD